MKRILSVFLTVSVLLTLVTATGLTVSAEAISEVVLDDVPTAVPGEEITVPEIPVADDAPYTAVGEWLDADQMPVTGTFEDGKVYYLAITVTAKEGNEFEYSGLEGLFIVEALINGDYHYSTWADPTEATFYIRHSFLTPIDTVEITGVVDAVIGETATVDGIAVPEDAEYRIDSAAWYDGNYEDATGSVFEDKNSYELEISLVSNEGYEFDEETILTVNGEEHLNWYADAEIATVWLTYDFSEVLEELALPAFPERHPIGEEFSYTGEVIAETEQYVLTEDWLVLNEEGQLEYFSGTFEEGNVYFYEHYVELKNGYALSEDTVITVDGEVIDGVYDTRGAYYASVLKMYNFSDLGEIETVEITIPEPVAGETIDPEAVSVPEDAKYTAEMSVWFASPDGSFMNSELAEGEFEADVYYTVLTAVSAVEGYIFAEDLQVTVNGEPFDLELPSDFLLNGPIATPTEIVLVYPFDPVAEEESSDPPSEDPSDDVKKGDVTGDGNINASDATRILLASVEKITLTEEQAAAADVNGDGKINAVDATMILLHAVGKKLIA